MHNIRKIFSILLVLACLFGLTACGGKTSTPVGTETVVGADIPEEDRYGGVLDLTYPSFSDNFDPHRTTGWVSYNWNCGVYENPMARGENGEYVPGVCEFELSEDMLELTLWPREGMTFHNGDTVEIEDVVASIDRSARNVANMEKYFAPYLAEGYPVVEGNRATYRFTEYNANTLYNFTHFSTWCAVMPKEILEKYGDEYINRMEDCIGTGPYKLTEYQTNAKLVLERYEGYIPTTLECGSYGAPKKGYMDKVNIWINSDETSVTMAMLSGQYDVGYLPDEYLERMDQYGLHITQEAGQRSMWAMAFNTKNPNRVVTKDVNLRKAIAAAMDVETFALAYGFLDYELELCPVGYAAYQNDIFDNADYAGAGNMDLAREYLEKSDYNGEEIVLLSGGQTPFSVVWEDTLKKLGLNVKVEYMESNAMKAYALENSNPYDCINFTYEIKEALPCQISVTPREKYWGNEEKDRLFDELTRHPDGSPESIALWEELSRLWVEDCAVVNLFAVRDSHIMDKDLNYNFKGMSFWYNAYWSNPAEHMD